MSNFWRNSQWVSRLILLVPSFIFAMIASRYLIDPVRAASAVGISFDTPLAMTIARVGFGGFPLACAIFTISCLFSARRILTGLSFVSVMMATVLVVRVGGMLADGTSRQNMRLVIAEIVFLALMQTGVFLELNRRRLETREGTA